MEDSIEICALSGNVLPTNREILGALFHSKDISTVKNYHRKVNYFIGSIANRVLEIWNNVNLNIPLIVLSSVKRKLQALIDLYNRKLNSKRMYADYVKILDNLFNIAKCSCFLRSETKTCICRNDEHKIPLRVLNFYMDQLTAREMCLKDLPPSDNSDENRSSVCSEQPQETIVQDCNFIKNNDSPAESEKNLMDSLQSLTLSDNSSINVMNSSDDPEYTPYFSSTSTPLNRLAINVPQTLNKLDLTPVARVADRRDISNAAVADLVLTTLKCIGAISKDNSKITVDPSKIRRDRIKSRKIVAIEKRAHANDSPLLAFHFDGKKSKSLQATKKPGLRTVKTTDIRDNIPIVKQPGDNFLGFITVETSSARNISKEILSFFASQHIELNELVAIGCDGASTNTGSQAGVLKLIEEHLNRPVHWIVCMLHMNEIVFNKIFVGEDGKTKSANTYSGVIGKELTGAVHKRAIVSFNKVSFGDMPSAFDGLGLRDDQKYIYDIASAVCSGFCSPTLARRKPGDVNVARWLSTAARILRFYVSSSEPSIVLIQMVEYIMKIYIPMWFRIRCAPTWSNGSRHIHHLIKSSIMYTPLYYSKYIKEVVGNNSYFIHSENLLLSMITDPKIEIRQKGYLQILKNRQNLGKSSSHLRIFNKPTRWNINYNCAHYSDLLNWNEYGQDLHEPPFTRGITTSTLRRFMQSDEILHVPPIPLHTQATEYFVQVVAQTVKNVASTANQNGYALSKVASRKAMPVFRSKKDYQSAL